MTTRCDDLEPRRPAQTPVALGAGHAELAETGEDVKQTTAVAQAAETTPRADEMDAFHPRTGHSVKMLLGEPPLTV
jgi:hypothetical protein